MKTVTIKELFNSSLTEANDDYEINAWVRNKRQGKSIAFLSVNDGSCFESLQVVLDVLELPEILEEEFSKINVGTSVKIKGKVVLSQGKGQSIEMHAKSYEILGVADADEYPLQPKKHSLEFLREVAHLRVRTTTFSSIFRIRHGLTIAIHDFFHKRGFYNVHTPILTGIDAEGAGELFQVATLKDAESNKNDFFGQPAYLAVTGQLEAELATLGLGKVYTFGPTFRAENSNTTRHLAEFWMVEPEIAFCDLDGCINLAEALLKYLIKYVLDNYFEELNFLSQRLINEEKCLPQNKRSEELVSRLKKVLETSFERITYTQAIEILRNSKPNKKKQFEFLVNEWGVDLQSEHEKFLVEKEFKAPVIVTDYPKEIKAFYMRLNEDKKTVRAMDILFPYIGEIIGGSQREERLEVLQDRLKSFNIPQENLWWYLETRKFGSVQHSGFGLGFERLLLFITGMTNIRDVILFPRTPKNIKF